MRIAALAYSLLWATDMRRVLWIIVIVLSSACGRPHIDDPLLPRHPGAPSPSTEAQNPLRIIVLDVGEGDATLIIAPTGESALVDAGPPGVGVILPLLTSLGVETLEAIIVTHFHEDHFGGVEKVLQGPDGRAGTADDLAPEGGIYDRGEPGDAPESPFFLPYVASTAGHRRPIHSGEQLRLGDVDLEIMAAGGVLSSGELIGLGEPPDENAASIVLLIEYAGFRMLLAADITGGGGNPPYQTPDVETALGPLVGDIDVLRVAHHGSHTSTNAAFLAATTPEIAIISVGDGNDYFHPHPSVIERLLGAGIAVYQTERGWPRTEGPLVAGGNIVVEVEADGDWSIDAE